MSHPFRLTLSALVSAALVAAAAPALAIEFSEAPTTMPKDPASLIGAYRAPEHAGFDGWSVVLGIMVNGFQAIEAYESEASGRLVLLAEWDMPSAEDESMPNWLITDALELKPSTENWFFSSLCEIADLPTEGVVALGSSSDGELMDIVDAAWQLDGWTGKAIALDPASVTCFTEGGE